MSLLLTLRFFMFFLKNISVLCAKLMLPHLISYVYLNVYFGTKHQLDSVIGVARFIVWCVGFVCEFSVLPKLGSPMLGAKLTPFSLAQV